MKKLKIEYENDGKKLSTYLTNIFPELNINTFYKALRKKDIKINGKRINDNVVVHYNDDIEVYISDDLLFNNQNNLKIDKIYEDNNIVVFNKPVGLEVVGTFSLTSIMKKQYNFLEPCHRIDRNTIGLVLFAKNQESLNILIDKFKNLEIEKHYIACCYGKAKNSDSLEAYLFKDSKKSIVYISDEPKKHYSKIQTSYELIDYNSTKNISLLDVTLHTGKTHQIRAHLAHCSLPIIGDGKYGSYELNKKFKVTTQLLCSYSLQFKFKSNSGILNYLDGTKIILEKIPFTEYLERKKI